MRLLLLRGTGLVGLLWCVAALLWRHGRLAGCQEQDGGGASSGKAGHEAGKNHAASDRAVSACGNRCRGRNWALELQAWCYLATVGRDRRRLDSSKMNLASVNGCQLTSCHRWRLV